MHSITLDPVKVEQVLTNLISNAVKFSHLGSRVEIRLERQAYRTVISVRDEGQGIPSEEIDRLFTWFGKTSVRGTDGEKSAGLGLAIAQDRVGTRRKDLGRERGRQRIHLLPFAALGA